MNITRIEKLTIFYSEPGITARKISENPAFEIVWLKLEAGAYLKPHVTPFDVQFLVKKGPATFEIGTESILAEEDQIIRCKGSIPHGIKNNGVEEIIVLVIKHLNVNV